MMIQDDELKAALRNACREILRLRSTLSEFRQTLSNMTKDLPRPSVTQISISRIAADNTQPWDVANLAKDWHFYFERDEEE